MIGAAVGVVAAIGARLLVSVHGRPDVVIALVVGIPGAVGLLLVVFSTRRWVTTLGALALAMVPGWFGVLVAIQVASGA